MANVLIIGGGVSGLSAGIYSLMQGHSVTICEQHGIAGGNLTGWKRGEYLIDNCIHWLSGTNPASHLYRMWTDLGVLGGVKIHYGESLYTVEHEGKTLGLYLDLDRLEHEMLRLSPADAREILDLTKAVRRVQFLNGVGGPEFDSKYGTFKGAAAALTLAKYYRMTAGDLAARFSHPLIKKLIVSLFTEHFGALGLIFVFADYCSKNAGIPEGGSIPAAERMTQRFLNLGGRLLTNKRAVKAELHDGKVSSVCFSDEMQLEADYYVFTQDPGTLFGNILSLPMPKQIGELYRDEGLMRFSSWHCAFGCDAAKLPFSGDFIFDLEGGLSTALNAHHLVIREFSHVPHSAPEGKSLIETLVFCDENNARAFIDLRNDAAAYKTKKNELAGLTARAIEQKLPQLAGKLTLIDLWTPATYKRYTNSEIGSYMSFAFSKNVLPAPVSGIIDGADNAFLATQWLRPPGGLPIAAEAGMRAAKLIEKAESRRRREKE